MKFYAMLLVSLFLSFTNLFAEEIDGASAIKELKKMTREYSKPAYVHIKFKQKQLMELLGDKKSSKGELFYSSKKLRIELLGDQHSTTLFTPGVITSISYDENNRAIQVLKSKPYPHPLLNLIFGEENTWDDFEVTEIRRDNKSVLEVQIVPKDPKKLPGIDRMDLTVNKKKSEIQKIVYWDEIGNETTNEFITQKKSQKVDGTKFVLVPPAGVEVKNL